MTRTELKALAERWMTFWQGRSLDHWDDIHAAEFIDESSAGREKSRTAFKQSVVDLYKAFPDFDAVAHSILVDEPAQSVTVYWTATGTHKGPFMGETPHGKPVDFKGIEIIACADGRVTNRWGSWNGTEILNQIRR